MPVDSLHLWKYVVQLACNGGLRHYDYDAFGNELAPNENDDNPLRYCGEYWDDETGTYYLSARQYSPITGRFTTEDPHWTVGNMIYDENGSIIFTMRMAMWYN